jgi:hypothetical protein
MTILMGENNSDSFIHSIDIFFTIYNRI